MLDELETRKDLDEITTDSDIMSEPEEKTLSEFDAIIADSETTTARLRTVGCRPRIAANLWTPATKQLNLTPATAAPQSAKVSLPNKLPVLDPRLCISISKVLNFTSVLKVSHDLFSCTSFLALRVVGTIQPK